MCVSALQEMLFDLYVWRVDVSKYRHGYLIGIFVLVCVTVTVTVTIE